MNAINTGYSRRWAVLALVLAAECMDLLDGSIVNVAAPTIRTDLKASAAALQWGHGFSGYLIGERYLNGKAAALDVPFGQGHVVLVGFRPEWRGQPFGAFRVLFNSVLFH